jgi:histone H3/H4
MNAAQISALSQIQAQAIVNARPSTALIAGGVTDKNAAPTKQQITNQIQLQAQALVHAHTQAQIAAGIYKGGEAPKSGVNVAAGSASSSASKSKPTATSAVPSSSVGTKPLAKTQPAPTGAPPSTIAGGSISILSAITPSQLAQQNQLASKHAMAEKALAGRQASEKAALRPSHPSQATALAARHGAQMAKAKAASEKEMAELHTEFRKQNAAAEYAGVRVATIPNPSADGGVAGGAPAGVSMQAAPTPHPAAAVQPMEISEGGGGGGRSSLMDESGPVCSATSPTFINKLNTSLQSFWTDQLMDMRKLGLVKPQTEQDFKNHNDLPLARIKRIMKSDEDVRMISAEAPVLFAKACEMFILELTLRSWSYSENNKRRTLQKEDIKEAIQRTDIFDFLVDVIH